MTYVRAQGTVVVSDCPGAVPSGTGALGAVDLQDPTARKVAELQLEINRFTGPAAPAAVRVADTPLAITGRYDQATPILMSAVLMKRMGNLAGVVPPDVSAQLLQEAARWGLTEYALAHLDEGIQIVRQYAASKAGVPPAAPMPGSGVVGRIMALGTVEKLVLAAGVALAIFGSKRRRS